MVSIGQVTMVRLALPADLAYRTLVVRATQAICRPLKQSQQWVDALASAVGEAFNNAVFHAYSHSIGQPAQPVEFEFELTPGAIEVRVLDWGRGFQLADVPLPRLDVPAGDIADLPESGMGLYIIRELTSWVDYRRGSPNVLAMRKDLAQPRQELWQGGLQGP
jgi:serine/threonine-protein kinase RsbW